MQVKPLKIAVVDDDQIYQFIIHRTFTKLDPASKILNFTNCADFLNFLKRNSRDAHMLPDLVLLDLNTPFMNGWEFLEIYENIRTTLSKIPDIYLVSSSVDPNDAELAESYETIEGFITKPLIPEQVLEMVHRIMVKNT